MFPKMLHIPQYRSFPDIDLHIMGIASEYPQQTCNAKQFRDFALKHYPSTPAYVVVPLLTSYPANIHPASRRFS